MPNASLNSDALIDYRTAYLIEAAYTLNGYQLKWATVGLVDLDQFTITDGVELMKIIVDRLQCMQTWNAQLNKKEFRDGDGPGFRWEGDDLIMTLCTRDSIPSTYKPKIRRAFAIQMGWWV